MGRWGEQFIWAGNYRTKEAKIYAYARPILFFRYARGAGESPVPFTLALAHCASHSTLTPK